MQYKSKRIKTSKIRATVLLTIAGLLLIAVSTVYVPKVAHAAPLLIAGNVRIVGAPAPRPLCDDTKCIIDRYVDPFIKTFSALAGVAVVISLIVAGIQYSSASGDPSKIAAAKSRIGKSIVALLFFIFLYAFLNYIVPGGIG